MGEGLLTYNRKDRRFSKLTQWLHTHRYRGMSPCVYMYVSLSVCWEFSSVLYFDIALMSLLSFF